MWMFPSSLFRKQKYNTLINSIYTLAIKENNYEQEWFLF